MKVARLYSFTDIRIEEMSVPDVGPREALLRVRASGICSGDVMPWYIENKAPLVLGHEPAGEIIKTGPGVEEFSEGDRVFVHHHAPCMACASCRRGDHVQCETWKKSAIVPGGLAEYILIPEINLSTDTLGLPEEMSFEDATLVEPAACVVKSLRRSTMKEGDTVLIIGLGAMGMMHLLLARAGGAKRVIGADMVDFRLEKALELGCDTVVDVKKEPLWGVIMTLTEGRKADIVFVCPSSVDAINVGLQSVAPGGTVVLFTPAGPEELLTIDPNYLYFQDISIVTSYSCGPEDTKKALKLVAEGTVNADKLVTHRFPLSETEKAYRMVSHARDSLKVLITFP